MANDLNTVTLVGRLTRDVDVKYTNQGMAIGNFAIAVNRSRKSADGYKDEASFFDVKLLGKIAESLKPYLTKGQQVGIIGYLTQERWEGQDGQKHSRVVIVAEETELLGGKKDAGSDGLNF